MKEFIVWNELTKEFDIELYKYVLDCNGRLLERSKNNNSSVLYFDNNLKPFFDTGLKDINENSIYADCSIVEFEWGQNKHEIVGYFTFNLEFLQYEIIMLNRLVGESCAYSPFECKNFKIIDTIQENKLRLIK